MDITKLLAFQKLAKNIEGLVRRLQLEVDFENGTRYILRRIGWVCASL